MRLFYTLISNVERRDLGVISAYDMGDFDLTKLWHGIRFEEAGIRHVRLYLKAEGRIPSDFVRNPVSWPICSERLLNLMMPFCSNDAQVMPAPLFDEISREPVAGYVLLNLMRIIPCLDVYRSVLSRSEDEQRIVAVYEYVLKTKSIPGSAHLFRIGEWPYAIVISEQVKQVIAGKGLRGLALVKCGSTE